MKKRTLSLITVIAVLLTTVCMPVSASTGIISSENPIVFRNQTEAVYASNNSIASGTLGYLQQHHLNTVATDTASDDYFGALSFKIKADAANMTQAENRDTFTFIVQDVDANSSTNKNENNVFIMDYNGYMRANYSETGWNVAEGTPYNNNQWYTVGILLKKDQTYDCFIDGVKVSTTRNNKEWSKTTGSLKFLFNISNNGKYYIDELTWSKYTDDSFIAETNKVKVANGGSVSVNFSEPVAAYDLSKIKVYECETGDEITGITPSFENETLTVTMPDGGMTPGKEYRAELNDIKGAFGRTLATDNVYFNCEIEGNEVTETIGADDFDDFSATTATLPYSGDADYYQPAGWYLGHKWNSQTSTFVRPVSGDANYATAMQIGLLGTDGGSATAYMPLSQKVDSGIVTISYDMKPERANKTYLTGGSYHENGIAPNLMVMVYPDGIDSSDLTWAQGDSTSIGKDTYGKTIAGIFAHKIAAVKSTWNTNDHIVLKNLTTDADDTAKVSSADAKWYNVKIELDFDKGTTKYWLDGEETAGAALSTLGVTSIKGISFGARSNATDASTLIDNVKVQYTHIANIKTDTVKTEDFDDFATTATLPLSTDTDYNQPLGWYLAHKWPSQTASFFRPATDTEKGAVLQVGNAGSDGGSSHGYMPLGKNINSGIVTISYDMKPERAIATYYTGGQQHNNGASPDLMLMVYPDGIADSDMEWAQGDSASIGNDTYGKTIAGIFSQQIAAVNTTWSTGSYNVLKTLTMDTTDVNKVADTDSKWYNVKIELNFDEGTTTYWLDDVKTVGATLSDLGVDAIQGLSFGVRSNSTDASTLIDNISVTHTYEDNSSAGVMQVRFSDYYGKNYGTATTYTTVLDTIGISFWSTEMDEASFTESTVKLIDTSDNSEVAYEGTFDADNDVYLMNLREYLTKDTEYTLVIDGVTANGAEIDSYEQTIKSDAEGVVIVEPMYIWNNSDAAATGTLAEGDTITAGTRLINTTGETENYAFFMALYAGDALYKADFAEVEQDGATSAEDKEANVSCSFTMSADDAAAITKVRTFLWDGMTTMKPVTKFAEFTKTAE